MTTEKRKLTSRFFFDCAINGTKDEYNELKENYEINYDYSRLKNDSLNKEQLDKLWVELTSPDNWSCNDH